MNISKHEIKRLAMYQPELVKTLLYILAFADEDGLIAVDEELMGAVLRRNTFKTQDYIKRLVDSHFIKPIMNLDGSGNIVYQVLLAHL